MTDSVCLKKKENMLAPPASVFEKNTCGRRRAHHQSIFNSIYWQSKIQRARLGRHSIIENFLTLFLKFGLN